MRRREVPLRRHPPNVHPFQPVSSAIPTAPTTIDLEYFHSPSMASKQQQLTLKLLIDNRSDKVLFAEAGKDVVDFLFGLLSIPVGTVVKLLATEGMPMVGCIGNLYKSVECLDDSCLQSGHARTMLLNPTLPSDYLLKNTLSLTGASPSGGALPAGHALKFYRCYGHCRTCTSFCGTICPSCHNQMTTEMTRVDSDSEKEVAAAAASVGEAGFVKGVVTYTVTDDLTVTQLSSISSITMLAKCNVGDLSSLEERVVEIGMKEGLEILKASLQSSKMVLTDIFIGDKKKRNNTS
ncbi:uncharacterized protein M6B38_128430 [Iris pallida]|uniref:DUF674 domain-containing protein n=1 Tax=Iris pallida TaxID=29817 RepID=A0AAX6G5F2_IRIPA|nr:uncharacterized protein M6B38_128430 [Iris pallida]